MKEAMREWTAADQISGTCLYGAINDLNDSGMCYWSKILERDCRINNLNEEAARRVCDYMSGRLGNW